MLGMDVFFAIFTGFAIAKLCRLVCRFGRKTRKCILFSDRQVADLHLNPAAENDIHYWDVTFFPLLHGIIVVAVCSSVGRFFR